MPEHRLPRHVPRREKGEGEGGAFPCLGAGFGERVGVSDDGGGGDVGGGGGGDIGAGVLVDGVGAGGAGVVCDVIFGPLAGCAPLS